MTKAQIADRIEACKELRKMLRPGQTIYTIAQSVARSGMSRHIALAIVRKGEIIQINWLAARALGYRQGKQGGLVVGGCGMDMGFKLVYDLGATLWPNGTSKPHGKRNGEPDSSGGYALKHHWL